MVSDLASFLRSSSGNSVRFSSSVPRTTVTSPKFSAGRNKKRAGEMPIGPVAHLGSGAGFRHVRRARRVWDRGPVPERARTRRFGRVRIILYWGHIGVIRCGPVMKRTGRMAPFRYTIVQASVRRKLGLD